ncbi:hypothetical protein KUV89_01660 [Marinobacter hydrocarbonoclasticus]|nr:hypothetical protein [Marinobacter nauticus]
MTSNPKFHKTEEAQILGYIKEATGMNTGQLASFLCTSPETIRRWQRGTMRARGPALGLLRLLAMNNSWSVREAIQIGKFNDRHPKAVDTPDVLKLLFGIQNSD